MSNATWKKIILGLTALSILTIGGCVAFVDHWLDRLTAYMCAKFIIDQTPSPSGKLKAVIYQRDCGATSDFNSLVGIVPGSKNVSEKNSPPGNFFGAEKGHSSAPRNKRHGPELRLKWLSENCLEIQYHESVLVTHSEKSSEGVDIAYRTFC